MNVSDLVQFPTYGEGGSYILVGLAPEGSHMHLSSDLYAMGGDQLPIPSDQEVWPWYCSYQPDPEVFDTCNIYLVPQELREWCDRVSAESDEHDSWGCPSMLRAFADLLEAAPEFELGEPVLTDQPWPKF